MTDYDKYPPHSVMHNPRLGILIMAVMIKRLGGHVLITQADIDDIAWNRFEQNQLEDGSIEFIMELRKPSA